MHSVTLKICCITSVTQKILILSHNKSIITKPWINLFINTFKYKMLLNPITFLKRKTISTLIYSKSNSNKFLPIFADENNLGRCKALSLLVPSLLFGVPPDFGALQKDRAPQFIIWLCELHRPSVSLHASFRMAQPLFHGHSALHNGLSHSLCLRQAYGHGRRAVSLGILFPLQFIAKIYMKKNNLEISLPLGGKSIGGQTHQRARAWAPQQTAQRAEVGLKNAMRV